MSAGIGSSDPSSESAIGFRNPRIQRLRRLVAERSERRSSGLIVVEGEVLIREALSARWRCEEEFVAAGALPVTNGTVHTVAEGVLDRVVSTESARPHVALFAVPEPTSVADSSTVLVADRLSDPGNLGTVIRSAEAAGFDAVVVTPGTVDDLSPNVVRASAGSRFHVPVSEMPLDALREAGFTLIASSSHRGSAHVDTDWAGPDRLALVLGNEAHGVDPDAPVDGWVRIAHGGRAESLNVAMASSILCFTVAQGRGLL
ncbi:MAG: RNA methyltransferase [Acidimicrobiia bacterium]|nr:RNA methyltransferase [Acidimicrobiia bacterium]